MIVAIDGPAGSGKSTIAKKVAKQLGFWYLDTGAMYRAVAWLSNHEGVDPNDANAMAKLAQDAKIEFGFTPGAELPTKVIINDHDVTAAIRTPEIDSMVSIVSAIPEVRAALVSTQREIAHKQDSVLEGRDIGSTVFPDAEVKVFLTATPEVRARRRAGQNARRHGHADVKQVYEALLERDKIDSSRECSPLVKAEGAITIDTSNITPKQVISKIKALVQAAQSAKAAQ